MVDDNSIGMAFSAQDLREIKQLEKEKLEAERLSAVGHTVAGLAHGIKNLNTALEGGMYMLKTGLAQRKHRSYSKRHGNVGTEYRTDFNICKSIFNLFQRP